MSNFIVGDAARISFEVRDISGKLAAPTDIKLFIKPPGGILVDHSSEIVNDGVGQYHFDLLLDSPGTYMFRCLTTGANRAAEEGGIFVHPQTVI